MTTSNLQRDLLTSGPFQRLTRTAQLIFLHAITWTDDYGRIHSDVYEWRSKVAPGFTLEEIEDALEQLSRLDLMVPYEVNGILFYEIPYFIKANRFNFNYRLKALYPHPISGEIEEPITFGELARTGKIQAEQGSQAAQESLRATSVVRTNYISVVSCNDSLEKRKQLTTDLNYVRSTAVERPPVQPPFMFVETPGLDRLEARVMRLANAKIPSAQIVKAVNVPPGEVEKIFAKLADLKLLKNAIAQ